MTIELKAEIKKVVSQKNGEVYYRLNLVDLGKEMWLNQTEVKLLKFLYPTSNVEE